MMIRWPGRVRPRLDREHLASNVDVWPTLYGLLGLSVPEGLTGINLMDGRMVELRQRVFGEQYAHDVADVAEPTRSLECRWMIDGWRKLIVSRSGEGGSSRVELYDLREDPGETQDLAARRPVEVLRRLGDLDAWWEPAAGR
jgi:uncharacterized sulfatase